MVRQRHPLNGRELEQILGERGGQEAWRAASMGPKRQQQTEVPGQLLGGGVRCVRLMGIQHHSWAPTVTQTVKSPPAMQEPMFDPWVGKIPWRRAWQPTPVVHA